MSRQGEDLDCKVYIGDLARGTNEKDVERACTYYGPLKSVWVARNPAGFSFVEFEDPRDAEDAVNGLDGSTLNGTRIRAEHSTGKIRPKPWLRGGRGGGRRAFHPEDKCYQCGERGHYAYDCNRYGRGGGGGGSRRYSRSRSRSRSRGRRSYSRDRRSYSRSRSRSRDRDRRGGRSDRNDRRRSRDRYSRDRYSREKRRSRSASRSRSRSPQRNDN